MGYEKEIAAAIGPTHKRIIWWATFTAVTAAVLGITARSAKWSWAVITLAISLLLCMVKFFQWTHADLDLWVIRTLSPKRRSWSVAIFAVLSFLVGYLFLLVGW
jgi:hypothetical protein